MLWVYAFTFLRLSNSPPPWLLAGLILQSAGGHFSHFVQKRRSPFCLTYTRTREAGDESSYPTPNATPKPSKIKPNSKAAYPEVFLLKGGPKKKSGQHSVLVLASQIDLPKNQNLDKLKTSAGFPARNLLSEENWKNGFPTGKPPKSSSGFDFSSPLFCKKHQWQFNQQTFHVEVEERKRQSNRYMYI